MSYLYNVYCHYQTTAIGILTGYLSATSGTAHVSGLDISKNMGEVHALMGVCPQDNLLWERLTAREHLEFYARLKGLSGRSRSRELGESTTMIKKCLDMYGYINANLHSIYVRFCIHRGLILNQRLTL